MSPMDQEQTRLAIKKGGFHGSGISGDPVAAPFPKKKPFAEEGAKGPYNP